MYKEITASMTFGLLGFMLVLWVHWSNMISWDLLKSNTKRIWRPKWESEEHGLDVCWEKKQTAPHMLLYIKEKKKEETTTQEWVFWTPEDWLTELIHVPRCCPTYQTARWVLKLYHCKHLIDVFRNVNDAPQPGHYQWQLNETGLGGKGTAHYQLS